jgi:hypothetical protein
LAKGAREQIFVMAHQSWFSTAGTDGGVFPSLGDFQNALASSKREKALRARLSNFCTCAC